MLRLNHTPRARADMTDIWLYIGAENPRAADRVLDAIYHRLEMLLQHPHSGLSREDIGPGVRRVVIGQYLVFYSVSAETVDVLRVLHGKRRIEPETLT